MRIGPQEIILIVLVILAIIIILRVLRISRGTNRQNEDTSTTSMTGQHEQKTNRLLNFFRKIGFVLVTASIILILAGVSMFKWALQSYLWSFIILVIGFIFIFLFRKR